MYEERSVRKTRCTSSQHIASRTVDRRGAPTNGTDAPPGLGDHHGYSIGLPRERPLCPSFLDCGTGTIRRRRAAANCRGGTIRRQNSTTRTPSHSHGDGFGPGGKRRNHRRQFDPTRAGRTDQTTDAVAANRPRELGATGCGSQAICAGFASTPGQGLPTRQPQNPPRPGSREFRPRGAW